MCKGAREGGREGGAGAGAEGRVGCKCGICPNSK